MAEYGAHLTSATASDRPSFFEVLAQESLMLTLRPAMTYLMKILAEHNPAHYEALYKYADEIYLTLDLLLQHHFLSTTSASFAENFYSLKRVPIGSLGSSTPSATQGLRTLQHLRSLVFLVLVPYLKHKLETLFRRWQDEILDRLQERNSDGLRLRKIFSVVYFYQLRYLFHKSDCHSPFLQLAGVRLKYMSKEDILDQMRTVDTAVNYTNSWTAIIHRYFKKVLGILAVSISQGLSVGIFLLQFLEWWYASQDTQTRLAVTALPIPNPPKFLATTDLVETTIIIPQMLMKNSKKSLSSREKMERSSEGILPEDTALCPLCHKKRTNDTALSTSGYVFCYPCIYSFIKGHHCCPVTSYPTQLTHLIKLYPPDS